ncbi:MAG: sulfotransferase [Gammaproteobacteria bacterium]|nr:sulfotransferase [Gammaproteobacteria bacterium]
MHPLINNPSNDNCFQPIFIVGNPRSGTTLLAVLIDRHSDISIPPETHYYDQFIHEFRMKLNNLSKGQMVRYALENERIKDLNLDYHEVLEIFTKYERSKANLLRSILECYAEKRNKKIFGEKTPMHLRFVNEIMSDFPAAKIICIIRDGRDSILSTLNAPWGMAEVPRRLEKLCVKWRENAKKSLKYLNKYPNNFTLLKYEDLLLNPENELKKLCVFIGVKYEQRLLDQNIQSDVVPEWETDWKGNSYKGIDASRIEAWRKTSDNNKIWIMNSMMGNTLKKHGYRSTHLEGCPVHKKIILMIKTIAYIQHIRPISRACIRLLRALKLTA